MFSLKRNISLLIGLFLVTSSCVFAQQPPKVHAHRGFRGLMPENTIAAMKNALDLQAAVLEMDVCFTKDKKVVVSHDPWLNHNTTLDKFGNSIAAGKGLALYQMNYKEVKTYDIGTKPNEKFPKQKNSKAYMPLLSELIDSVEQYAKSKGSPKPFYNIETKTSEERDGIYQPAPKEYVKRLMKIIQNKKIQERVIIQSFDPRTLELIHVQYPKIPLMLLTVKGGLEENLNKLTFLPTYYCPAPKLINKELLEVCRDKGIKVVGGNTNNQKEIKRLLNLGVDEFISDYPYTSAK
jgi:glycerophosphoryl diester phosphodiesterase